MTRPSLRSVPPTQASIFRIFQYAIWNGEGLPAYATFKNANTTAATMGAKQVKKYPIILHRPSTFWIEYLFPDGSIVCILSDGSAFDSPGQPSIRNELFEGEC